MHVDTIDCGNQSLSLSLLILSLSLLPSIQTVSPSHEPQSLLFPMLRKSPFDSGEHFRLGTFLAVFLAAAGRVLVLP